MTIAMDKPAMIALMVSTVAITPPTKPSAAMDSRIAPVHLRNSIS